ncbi:MAG TPA: EamA family transporter [Acidobacteriaceae bacterium]|jgi:drug/metabolite transporter (DMT)-like permease|nr:EamA family transporter [Acidobacteriaceae bacterium]
MSPLEQQSRQCIVSGRRASRGAGYVACALAGCCWGTGFFFGKIAFTRLGVGHYVFYRFVFACLGMLPIVERPRFSGQEWRLLLIGAFLGIPVQFLVQFQGLKLTTVSHAALMVGTMPVILAVGATVFAHERLDVKGWLALVGSTLGIALIVLSASHGGIHGGNLWGDLLVVLSLVIALGWVLINQRLMVLGRSPMAVTAWTLLTGSAMLAPWVLWRDGLPPVRGLGWHVWFAVVASGLICTAAATLLWNWGIHRVPASRAGVFLNIEPALGSILGVLILGDRLGPGTWVGGALIIVAAVVLTTGRGEAGIPIEA